MPKQSSSTAQFSREYLNLMPKRKERMAGCIRESDERLADSTTIDSAAKAVRLYGEKEGYIYDSVYEYKEAISAYSVPYFQRPELMKMLKAAERHEFDVLVITEVRALSRKGAGEVFIIYEMLQKYGIRLETIHERFSDDPVGELVLSFKATYAKLEREQSYLRLQRGKADRIALGKAPNGHHAAYGYILVDTEREVKGRHEFDAEVVYTDEDGVHWSRHRVCLFIFDLLKDGGSLHGTAKRLNDMGIPSPRNGHWTASTLQRIVTNPIYMGEVWANRYKQIEREIAKSPTSHEKRKIKVMVERTKEEWIRLPDAPAMIDRETFEAIQRQLQYNKQDSIRNNKHAEQLGLLRGGYIFCGICGRRMSLRYPAPRKGRTLDSPRYQCRQNAGGELGNIHNHTTQIRLPLIEGKAKEKISEVLRNHEMVRSKVENWRQANKPVVDSTQIEESIENIRRSMKNIYTLAERATDDETIANLTKRMNELEDRKREAESLLYDASDDEEEREELEKELQKFEKWVTDVKPHLTDPEYMASASYEELRLAIRILGLRVTVFPTIGEWPYRYQIEVTMPEIMEKLHSVAMEPYIL